MVGERQVVRPPSHFMNNFYLTSMLAVMAAMLYFLYRNESGKARSGRNNIFSDCSTLLAQAAETQAAIGFPTLKGRYDGYQVILEAYADTLSMRKLPPLWLTITVTGKQRSHGSLDVLVRPQNIEVDSPAWEWNDTLSIPHNWPRHAIVKYHGTLAPLDIVGDFVAELFIDEKVKELLITPAAVRITYMAKQADRGEYLIMRNAAFDGLPLRRETVAALLHSATDLRKKLEGACLNDR
jgi:hypothetical protein